MNIITGYVGEPHITAAQDRAQNQGCFGTGSYILNVGEFLAATAYSATEIHVADGALSHQGCVGVIEKGTYDVIEIDPGTQSRNRIDLIVCRYERDAVTNAESLSLLAIKGTPTSSTPSAPAYTNGDIQSGDLVADMPLYEVRLTGVSITSITKVASHVRTQAELDTTVKSHGTSISSMVGDISAIEQAQHALEGDITQINIKIGQIEDDIMMTQSDNLLSSSATIAAGAQQYVTVTLPSKPGYSLIAAVPRSLTGSSNAKIMTELDLGQGYLKLFNTHTSSITISAVSYNLIWKKVL